MIWEYKLPLEPLERKILVLFSFSKIFFIKLIGIRKFEATPIWISVASKLLLGKPTKNIKIYDAVKTIFIFLIKVYIKLIKQWD